jgi:hypothetical protein
MSHGKYPSNQVGFEELKEMLSKGQDAMDDESVQTLEDFMGIMAETEFYHLF